MARTRHYPATDAELRQITDWVRENRAFSDLIVCCHCKKAFMVREHIDSDFCLVHSEVRKQREDGYVFGNRNQLRLLEDSGLPWRERPGQLLPHGSNYRRVKAETSIYIPRWVATALAYTIRMNRPTRILILRRLAQMSVDDRQRTFQKAKAVKALDKTAPIQHVLKDLVAPEGSGYLR